MNGKIEYVCISFGDRVRPPYSCFIGRKDMQGRMRSYRRARWPLLIASALAGQLSDADAALLRSLGRKRLERRSITLVIPSKEQGVSYLYVHRTDGTSRKYKRTRWGDLMVWATMGGLLTTEARLLHSLGRGGDS